MSNYIKRVVYPRDTNPDFGWIGPLLAAQVPEWAQPAFQQQIESFIAPRRSYKRPHRGAVRSSVATVNAVASAAQLSGGFLVPRRPGFVLLYRHEAGTGSNDGWLTFEPDLRVKSEPLAQLAGSFRMPGKRHVHDPYRHGFSADDHSWIIETLDVGAAEFFPALLQQSESFRTKRRKHVGFPRPGGIRERVDPTIVVAPGVQSLGGFLSDRRRGFSLAHHSWLDDAAGIFATIPTVAFNAAYEQLLASYTAPRRKARPHDLLLWDVNRRMAGAFSEDVTIWTPALQQSLESFLYRSLPSLDVRLHGFVFEGWISIAERDDTAIQRPAQEQLLASFLVGRRAGFNLFHHGLSEVVVPDIDITAFDEALWPGIGDLLRAFRSDPGRRLDVRRLDAPFDAWLSFDPVFNVPLFTPAIIGLSESFRSPDRRVTMDLWGSEWQHDMAWLRDVLTLPDPEPRRSRRLLPILGVGR